MAGICVAAPSKRASCICVATTISRIYGLKMQNSGYLGGDVSMAERFRLRDKHLSPHIAAGKARDLGPRNQCRCGRTTYVKWRGRFYCIGCARFVRKPMNV